MHPLPVICDVLFAAFGLVLGLVHGRSLFKRGVRLSSTDLPRQARLLVSLGGGFVLMNMVYLPVRHYNVTSWYLPVFLDYHGVVGMWILDLLLMSFLSGAAIAVAMLERHALRWGLPLMAIMFLAAAMQTYHTFYLSAPPILRPARVSADGVIQQTNGSTCAAATCANIATFLGMPRSEEEMVALLGTTDNGTSDAEIIHGMRKLGFHCAKRYLRDRDASRLVAPAVLLVDLAGQADGHAVAYMGQKDGKSEIWNPTGGKQWLEAEALRVMWRGRAIEVRR